MRRFAIFAVLVALLAALTPAGATFPFRPGPDVYDYAALRIQNGSCMPLAPSQKTPPGTDLPAGFDCRSHWKLADYAAQQGDADYDPLVAMNPQELFGVKGPGTNRAWEITTGRPDTIIAVLDSGIRWSENTPKLVNKFYLNRGELPVPGTSTKGGTLQDYDVNDDGVFNVKDYASFVFDFADDQNSYLDPADLIRIYSDGVDDDGNGYTDDISGWDFFEGDNNAGDDTSYGHGTGESEDSAAEVEVDGSVTQCPNCMLMEMRVGDSFVADINHWAEATIYAVDNGASVVQEALGTLNHTAYGQAAADYAWNNGVLVVASQADEAAGHHNYPAALNHTMLVNSVTEFASESGVAIQYPKTYLAFNGCTNFGGYSWVTIASVSCSSDATGQSSGYAGLLYSAARNAIERGVIAPRRDTNGRSLSAAEAKQLFRLGAQDVDFSSPAPPFPPNNFFTTLPASQRYVTTAGWDQITGWGRATSNAMVRMVDAGQIPPEADIVSPRWWQPLPGRGTIDVVGRVAAPRESSYTYEVQWAPGVQPPRWPATDTWRTASRGRGTRAFSGVLASIDLSEVRTAILTAPPVYTPADDPTSRDLPEKDAFRVRVVVRDSDPDTGDAIEQRQYFAYDDPSLLRGFPKFLGADGASSPAFEDIDDDGTDEIVIADGNGFVHAFKADGSEAAGFPVHTAPIALPRTGRNAYTRGVVSGRVFAPVLLGSPLVADLDRDGDIEISVADIEGNLWAWSHTGVLLPGFPVRGNPAFSEEPGCETIPGNAACDDFTADDVRDRINTVDRAFTANPSAGDLDPTVPGLEIVAGSNDGHVYAWHADGTPVAGWPVLLRDPAKVAGVHPVSHKVSFVPGSGVLFGRKVLATPSIGDIDGDGDLEVVVNVNEEYDEVPNWSLRDPALGALAGFKRHGDLDVTGMGNTRIYALHHDGTAHTQTATTAATPHPDDQAYVAGWPAKIGMLVTELLPYVGEGSNGSPVLADVDGDGTLEIATASIAGPGYLLNADGTSFYGTGPDGGYLTMASSAHEFKGAATDGPSFPALGGGAFGRMAGPDSPLSWAMGSGGLKRLLDVVLPEQQLGAEDHIGVWNARTGSYDAGFPAQVNDLQFFNTPAMADVDGDGLADVLQSTAMYDLRAYRAGGAAAVGFPKFTGGWSVVTPAVGDVNGDGKREVALVTREGNLFVWGTPADTCLGSEWPKYGHDLWNTSVHGTDADRPGSVDGIELQAPQAEGTHAVWDVARENGPCGRPAARYHIFVDGVFDQVVNAPPYSIVAEHVFDTRIRAFLSGVTDFDTISMRAQDFSGNLGPATTVRNPARPSMRPGIAE